MKKQVSQPHDTILRHDPAQLGIDPPSLELIYLAMLVSMLINQEADLESRAYDGSTALLRACETGNIRMVRTLLKAGVRFSSSAI